MDIFQDTSDLHTQIRGARRSATQIAAAESQLAVATDLGHAAARQWELVELARGGALS